MSEITENDIQIRFITHASRKIIINSNANFYLEGEKYDFSNESIEDKRHNELKQKILSALKLQKVFNQHLIDWESSSKMTPECGYSAMNQPFIEKVFSVLKSMKEESEK